MNRSEHCLEFMARVAKSIGASEAIDLAQRAACSRIRKQVAGRGGRGCTNEISTIDWKTVAEAVKTRGVDDLKACDLLSQAELNARRFNDQPKMPVSTPSNANSKDDSASKAKAMRRKSLRRKARKNASRNKGNTPRASGDGEAPNDDENDDEEEDEGETGGTPEGEARLV